MKPAILALLLSLAACGETALSLQDEPDAATAPADAGAPLDAGVLLDAGSSYDAGSSDDAGTTPDAGPAGPDLWITAYIAGWNLNVAPNAAYGTMPGSEMDYTAFTHGVLFATPVAADGTLQ